MTVSSCNPLQEKTLDKLSSTHAANSISGLHAMASEVPIEQQWAYVLKLEGHQAGVMLERVVINDLQ